MSKWIAKKYTEELIDVSTGELIRIKEIKIKRKEYDLYMKTYIENLKKIKPPSVTENEVLLRLCEGIRFNTSEVIVSRRLINILAKELNLTTRSINAAIESLVHKTILIQYGIRDYKLNPVFYWVGTEDEREKEIIKIREEQIAIRDGR